MIQAEHSVRQTRLKTVFVLWLALVLCWEGELRAERVGYRFTGSITTITTTSLFNQTLTKPAPFTATFSYDTTIPGANGGTGVRTYPQTIQGGFAMDIAGGQLQLSASEYLITVSNNFGANQRDIFNIEYSYDAAKSTNPPPILVNDVPWSGSGAKANMRLQLSWPGTTFTDPDEPKLTGDRPITPGATFSGIVSSGSPWIMTVTGIEAIVPIAGDYNHDSKFAHSDLLEWSGDYGQVGTSIPTDGNNDGVVDMLDYVIARMAQPSNSASSAQAVVPEPVSVSLSVLALASFVLFGRRRRY